MPGNTKKMPNFLIFNLPLYLPLWRDGMLKGAWEKVMQHTLASFHRQTNHGPRPSPPAQLATTPIKVDPVAFASVVNYVPTAD
jgi:hypothetical protein